MRNAFADEIRILAKKNDKIFMCPADIGNRLFDKYKDEVDGRFMNCGIAEANMISMAAGMAMCGLRPVTYTITPFITYRVFEQIRDDLCYHNVPVLFVGVGAGLSYANLGPTHHSCEDIGVLRTLPNLTIICPGDAVEVRCALRAALKHDGPVYIRLGKKNEPVIHKKNPDFIIGKALSVKDGRDVCILSTGNTLPMAIQAGEELDKKGFSSKVYSFHTVKPLDRDVLKEALSNFKAVVTVEEHSVVGGFGSAVGEWTIDNLPENATKLVKIGTPDEFWHEAGSQDYARKNLGITAENIVSKTLGLLKKC